MKRILPLLLTLSATPLAYAAPASVTTAKPAIPAVVDPAARVVLEQAAAAYKGIQGMKMDFVTYRQGAKETAPSTGNMSFSRPDKARSELQQGKTHFIVVADGKNTWMQMDPATYRKFPLSGAAGLQTGISTGGASLGLTMPAFIDGKSPLDIPYYNWESATLLPENGVKLKGSLQGNAAVKGIALSFNLYFDPNNHLLRRAESTVAMKGKTSTEIVVIGDVQVDPAFEDDRFTYTPPKGSKLYVDPVPKNQPLLYDARLKVGALPFALKGKDLTGKTPTFSQYKGKVVLLDFWATWCGPCVGELPNVFDNYKKYHPKGFEIVGVSLDEDKKALTDFIKSHDMKYPNLFDGKGWGNIDGKTYGVQSIPFSLLIGKDGKIAAVNPRGDMLEPAIKNALARK